MKPDRLFNTWFYVKEGKVSGHFDAHSIVGIIDIINRGSDLEVKLGKSSEPRLIENVYIELKDYNEIIKAKMRGEI